MSVEDVLAVAILERFREVEEVEDLRGKPSSIRPSGRGAWRLFNQVPIRTYRCDLVLVMRFASLAIECDGHDFHDRTKQQAAYDRARDRELLATGIPVVRFTGSEIFHSAERCADDVASVAKKLNSDGALAHLGRRHKEEIDIQRAILDELNTAPARNKSNLVVRIRGCRKDVVRQVVERMLGEGTIVMIPGAGIALSDFGRKAAHEAEAMESA